MLRISTCVFALTAATACAPTPVALAPASPPIDPHAVFYKVATDASRSLAESEPAPMPTPPAAPKLQSEVERLSHVELARWTIPAELASTVVGSDLLRGMTGRVHGIALYRAPVPTEHPGVCSLDNYSVSLSVPNEASLTYRQHLNPPLQPYQYYHLRRWRVVGSTIARQNPGQADCASARPYSEWFEAASASIVHRAVHRIEQAQRGLTQPKLDCQQMQYDEARKMEVYPACADARALLARFTPDLIRRVRAADCLSAPSPAGCLAVEYWDPAAPRTHSLYVVTVPDNERPAFIQIAQAMLPPH